MAHGADIVDIGGVRAGTQGEPVDAAEVRRTRHVVDMAASIAGTRPPSWVLRALA